MEGKTDMHRLLRPVRRRMAALRAARAAAYGLLTGSGAALLLLTAARLWPIPGARRYALALAAAGMLGGVLYAAVRRVSAREAARAMDRSGTDDAISTALELLGVDSPVVRLQRVDAAAAAERYVARLGERLPLPGWRAARGFAGCLAALWLAGAALLAIPNPMDDRIAAMAAAQRELAQLDEAARELREELEERGIAQDASRLTEPLDELRRRLDKLDDPQLVTSEIDRAMRELEQLSAELESREQALKSWSQAMQQSPPLRRLGQALESGDRDGMREAVDGLRRELQRLSAEERQALADKLGELAQSAPRPEGAGGNGAEADASPLKEALERVAEQARDSASDGASDSDALAGLERALASELAAAELDALARQMASRLGESGRALAAQPGAGGGAASAWSGGASGAAGASGASGGAAGAAAGEGGSGGSGAGQGEGGGSSGDGASGGSGAGQGAGQGAGAGSGGGAGQGAGAGSGAGSGTGSGQGAGAGGGSGAGGGAGGLQGGHGSGGRTLVTTPRSLAGESEPSSDGGPTTGGQIESGGEAPMIDGGAQSYEAVYSEYAAAAREAIGRSLLPQSMQRQVRDYFEEIQPNR